MPTQKAKICKTEDIDQQIVGNDAKYLVHNQPTTRTVHHHFTTQKTTSGHFKKIQRRTQ